VEIGFAGSLLWPRLARDMFKVSPIMGRAKKPWVFLALLAALAPMGALRQSVFILLPAAEISRATQKSWGSGVVSHGLMRARRVRCGRGSCWAKAENAC
jgi:hypothetical protein